MAEEEALIAWDLTWSAETPEVRHRGSDRTVGSLTIRVGGEEVWGHEDGEWPWIELLEWLTRSWPWLRADDGAPYPWFADLPSLSALEPVMAYAMRDEAAATYERAEQELWDFRQTHDLAKALVGGWSPPIVVWREGLLGHALTDSSHVTGSWQALLTSLTLLGDRIAERLGTLRAPDERSQAVLEAWQRREEAPAFHWRPVLWGETKQSSVIEFVEGHWDEVLTDGLEFSPILAAARMSYSLGDDVARHILDMVRAVEAYSTDVSDVARILAESVDIEPSARPYEQAYAYANAFRDFAGVVPSDPFDPEKWLRDHGVHVEEIFLGSAAIDAVAAWGPRNGPAVLVNRDGQHAKSQVGRNVSLAHEIGHLLMDRDSALPAAEVLGGRVSPKVEQRARAFAAELLLPQQIARERFSGLTTQADARSTVKSLTGRYGVSQEVIAWQARNSGVWLDGQVYAYLRSRVPVPERF